MFLRAEAAHQATVLPERYGGKIRTRTIVAGLTAGSSAWANPDGPTVVHGQVSVSRPDLNTLNITNSPGAVINWSSFSIGANETTRFIQQSASSSVLNRVIGRARHKYLVQLLSNGRVFLIQSERGGVWP